jgi:outer membrane protein W
MLVICIQTLICKNEIMKKFVPFVLALFMSMPMFAQTSSGSLLLGGSSNFNLSTEKSKTKIGSTSSETSKSFNLGLHPYIGYFVIDNLAAGISLSTSFSSSKETGGDGKLSTSFFTVGPFARYYFLDQGDLKPMAEIYFGVGSENSKSEGSGYSSKSKSGVTEFTLGVGASYFLTPHFALDALLSYGSSKYKTKESDMGEYGVKSTSSDLPVYTYTGVQFKVGIIVTMPGK